MRWQIITSSFKFLTEIDTVLDTERCQRILYNIYKEQGCQNEIKVGKWD